MLTRQGDASGRAKARRRKSKAKGDSTLGVASGGGAAAAAADTDAASATMRSMAQEIERLRAVGAAVAPSLRVLCSGADVATVPAAAVVVTHRKPRELTRPFNPTHRRLSARAPR